MDTFTSMRVFKAVVDSGSFAAAADHLQLSRGMVTKHVAALEQQLGARLLYRTTRRLTLTEVGADYLVRVGTILEHVDEAASVVSCKNGTPNGLIRMTSSVEFGQRRLGGLLAEFRREFPEIDIDLTLSNRHTDLVEEGYDLALRVNLHSVDEKLVGRPLMKPLNNMLLAAPSYLEANGTPRTPMDLVAHNCLYNKRRFETGHWIFGPESDPVEVAVKGSLVVNDTAVLIDAAREGLGIVLQPQVLVADDLVAGRLVELLPDWEKPSTTIYALYPARRFLPHKVRVLIDFLIDRLGNE
ncbi:LysR family transcriptional regulator [Mangrovitalea sediminis]|uniref:LysR family transcriptional regulator n=1 Tax=Mangrovitalea sediminis TaxID=1982043 RepID=UPI000BE502F8|nr:LysR family transcriptional regulator [Mangrovitalea sediminis]